MSKRKIFALVIALVLVCACVFSATLALLISKPDSVVNTFSPSTITITLDEAPYVPATNALDHTVTRVTKNENYKMVPGWDLPKDPMVTVVAGSEKCWLFVMVEEKNNVAQDNPEVKYLSYGIDETMDSAVTAAGETNKWTELTGVALPSGVTSAKVYYRVVNSNATNDQTYYVLKDNKVTVNSAITNEQMQTLTDETNYPKLNFTAYAIQYTKNGTTNFTVTEAWNAAIGQVN